MQFELPPTRCTHDAEQKSFLKFEELIPIMGVYVSENLNIERVGSKLKKTHSNRVDLDRLILLQQVADAFEYDMHLRRGRRVTKMQDRMKPELVALGEVLKAQIGDLAIGNADHGSVECSKAGGTEANIVNGTLAYRPLLSCLRRLCPIEDERHSADHIFQCLLRGECNGNPAHPESGKGRCWIHTEVVQALPECPQRLPIQSTIRRPNRSINVAPERLRQGRNLMMYSLQLAIDENDQPNAACDGKDAGQTGPELPRQ